MIMKRLILLFLAAVLLYSCSSFETAVKQEQKKPPEVYVFDDVSKVDTAKADTTKKPVPQTEVTEEKPAEPVSVKSFIVQVGAFTSKERAEAFIKENQNKILQKMNVSFSNQVQLYVVQLPSLSSREEAEKQRNELWKIPGFKDAFIIAIDGQK